MGIFAIFCSFYDVLQMLVFHKIFEGHIFPKSFDGRLLQFIAYRESACNSVIVVFVAEWCSADGGCRGKVSQACL